MKIMATLRQCVCFVLLAASTYAFAQRKETHDYDLLDVTWRIRYDEEERRIEGDVTNTVALTRSARRIWFDCGPLEIDEVSVDGTEADSDQRRGKLYVSLPEGTPVG